MDSELDQCKVKTIIGEVFYKVIGLCGKDFGPEDEIDDIAALLASVAAQHRVATTKAKEHALGIFKINATEIEN